MKESKTTYAYLIEHMQNPSFQKVWDIAYDFVHKLPSELCDELHESLNRGVDVLDSEPMLQMYIYAFGKMHNAKLLHAFNHLQDRVLKNDKIVIIDWGCGQGLASLCYHDYLKDCNSPQQVSQIVLIEPSSLALSRAELLCSCFYPDAEITAINKPFDTLTADDISVPSDELTIHLFSNILDVESYNLQHLIQTVTNLSSENNEYIIVSPIQNTLRTQRLKTFASSMDGYIYYENYLDKRQLDEERDWTCAVLLCSSISKEDMLESEYGKVFEDARTFFENKDNDPRGEEGIEIYHRLQYCAEQGDKRCQNELGLWYLHGVGTEQNIMLAVEWFEKAAEQDYASAFGNIGDLYRKGLGVEVDNQRAVQYYKEGADRKHYGCQYRLGICYLKGIGVDVDKDLAFSLFMDSSLQGYAPSMFALYLCYLNGWGTEKNENVAIKYLKKAVKGKHAKSYYILGSYYQSGLFVDKNEQKTVKLYIGSAKLGYAPAQEKLGDIYRQGLLGNEKSPKKSFNWYLKAAEQGRASAQFYVGYFYASGYGIKKDEELAFEWYTKAAEQKNAAALNNLAICFEYGKGTDVNLTKAIYYYEESAKSGNITAQKNLAICYKNGTGVELNPSKVFYWTLEAAKNGDVESQGKTALYHLRGYGTNIDHKEALLWYAKYYSKDVHINNANEAFNFFKKKADEGDSLALYVVGKCLQYGIVVDRNYKKAIDCFEKAAELGHIESLIKVHRISSLYELCSVTEDKNGYTDAYGVKYSKDKKILIDGGFPEGEIYQIASGTRVICNHAFDSGDVGKIIIPSSVVSIGKNPFAESGWGRCAVKNIECHSPQFEVSGSALYTKDRKKLISYFGKAQKVTIPEGVEIIGSKAFVENEDLIDVILPESLRSIEDAAFEYCLNLKRIVFPKNVTQISDLCFYGCESLEDVIILGEVEKIGKKAFKGCNIKELLLPKSLIEIDDNAFNSNKFLRTISIPENVKRIGKSSFAFCPLRNVYLNDSLEEIDDLCFFDCPIESIVIPSSMKSLGVNPFIGTTAIECMENCKYVAENGLLYDKQSGGLISHYSESEVALYPPIKHVNSFAFYNSNATDIFMGSNIVEVSAWAFYNAEKLEKIIWRKSRVSEIPAGCFGNCPKISKIDIPSCVENVHKGSFFDCYDLRMIRFERASTTANEEIFSRIERPTYIPFSYSPRHHLMGSTICEWTKRDVDPSTFPVIEVIVPQGNSRNIAFSPIYNHDTWNAHEYYGYGMDRRFIIREDEKE